MPQSRRCSRCKEEISKLAMESYENMSNALDNYFEGKFITYRTIGTEAANLLIGHSPSIKEFIDPPLFHSLHQFPPRASIEAIAPIVYRFPFRIRLGGQIEKLASEVFDLEGELIPLKEWLDQVFCVLNGDDVKMYTLLKDVRDKNTSHIAQSTTQDLKSASGILIGSRPFLEIYLISIAQYLRQIIKDKTR